MREGSVVLMGAGTVQQLEPERKGCPRVPQIPSHSWILYPVLPIVRLVVRNMCVNSNI